MWLASLASELSQLAKSFKDVQAVKDVSFTAQDGRITALLGPNGAGKSTTFRILSTVIQPDQGGANIDGVDVANDPMGARRKIGVMPHNAGLYTRLTGVENIEYFGRLQGLSKEALKKRLATLIESLNMGDFVHRRTAGFSQGQKIRRIGPCW